MAFNSQAKHVAIIMDGNGRWAQTRKKPVSVGHKKGAERVEEIIEASLNVGVKFLTIFAFSTENWQRPQLEVQYLMNLLAYTLKNKTKRFIDLGVKIKIIGDRQALSHPLIRSINRTEFKTQHNTQLQLNIALNYGGLWDIEQANIKILNAVHNNTIQPDAINTELLNSYTSLAGCPDPDLLIRTSGEQRISNFLLWNLEQTELCFVPEKWPDFTTQHYLTLLKQYNETQTITGTN